MGKRVIIPEARQNPITPEYEVLPPKPKSNFEIPQYIHNRSQAKKKNVSTFYDALCQSLRTGTVSKGVELDIDDPSLYGVGFETFRPDVLKLYEKGVEFTEVKVAQFRRGEFLCASRQLPKYYERLMERLELGDPLPSVNYAFVRYGNRDDYELHHCLKDGKKDGNGKHRCSNKCLTKNLTTKTKDVSFIHFPVLLGIVASSRFHRNKRMDHSTSSGRDNEDYIHLATRICSVLHGDKLKSPVKNMDDLLEDSIDQDLRKILMLDSFKIVRTVSPENLTCKPAGMGEYPIKQFPIVRFEIPEDAEKEWLKNFKRYNGELLTRCVGEISEDIPF